MVSLPKFILAIVNPPLHMMNFTGVNFPIVFKPG